MNPLVILFNLSLAFSAQVNIPVIEHANGNLELLGFVPAVHAQWLTPIFLSPTTITSFVSRFVYRGGPVQISLISPGMGNITYMDTRAIRNIDSRFLSRSNGVNLAVGPSSSIVRTFGSMSVIRNTSRLELCVGQSGSDFESRCVRNSTLTIPIFPDSSGLVSTVLVSFEVGDRNPAFSAVWMSIGGIHHLMTIPYSVAHPILSLLSRMGSWSFLGDEWKFHNCDSEVITVLPIIKLRFSGLTESVGEIHLYPEDYVIVDNNSRTCELLFRIESLFEMNHLQLNPLRIPGVSVRITNRAFQFCDPI